MTSSWKGRKDFTEASGKGRNPGSDSSGARCQFGMRHKPGSKMREIYLAAWDFVSWHWLSLALLAALLEVLPLMLPSGYQTATGAELVASTLIAYAMHRYFLFGESFSTWKKPQTGGQKPATGRFMLAFGVMLVALLGIVGAICVKMALGGADKVQMLSAAVLFGLLAYFVLLAVFGTALPAAAAGDRYGPWITLQRARRTSLSIAAGLLTGPVLFSIPVIGLTIFAGQNMPLTEGSVALIAFGVCARMGGFFITALAVAVLCRAYLTVAPPSVTDQMPA